MAGVRELWGAVTAEDYERALRFYRDVLGMPERAAFEVDDAEQATRDAEAAGAEIIAPPTRTPWNSLNARLSGPAGLQLTLFEELG